MNSCECYNTYTRVLASFPGPLPLNRTASDGKLGAGLGTRLPEYHLVTERDWTLLHCVYRCTLALTNVDWGSLSIVVYIVWSVFWHLEDNKVYFLGCPVNPLVWGHSSNVLCNWSPPPLFLRASGENCSLYLAGAPYPQEVAGWYWTQAFQLLSREHQGHNEGQLVQF